MLHPTIGAYKIKLEDFVGEIVQITFSGGENIQGEIIAIDENFMYLETVVMKCRKTKIVNRYNFDYFEIIPSKVKQ